jgi:hypothetical protein
LHAVGQEFRRFRHAVRRARAKVPPKRGTRESVAQGARMGIEYRGNRAYYYRKGRVGDRVRSEYVIGGRDEVVTLFREADRMIAQKAELEWLEWAVDAEAADTLNRFMQAHFDAVEAVAREAIEAAGYHRHKRGEWRKRRGH